MPNPEAEKYEAALRLLNRQLADLLKEHLPKDKKLGFAFLLFDFGPNGFMTYCSNAQRSDMLKALKEMVQKIEMDGGWN